MILSKNWGCCFLVLFSLAAGCRTDSGGKGSTPPPSPEQECKPEDTGKKDATARLKEELLRQGQWTQDGELWKAQNPGAMIFKSIALFQEKPELLENEGSTPEDKWAGFYQDAMKLKESGLTLAPVGKQSCP
jgi:hypothetical protein